MKIIAFAGRKGSGKGELAKICEKYGFKTVRFAFALKELVSHLVGFTVNENEETKSKKINLQLNDEQMEYVSNETSIPFEIINKTVGSIIFHSPREMLQIIGTDLIRKYAPNWHIDKLRNLILSDTESNYCIEDMRFPNEMKMVYDLGGESWFVIRMKIDNVSNHISETSLRWKDFGDNVILNNSSLEIFKLKWDIYLRYVIINPKYNFIDEKYMFGFNDNKSLREFLCDLIHKHFIKNKITNENEIISYISKKYDIESAVLLHILDILLIHIERYFTDKILDEIDIKDLIIINDGISPFIIKKLSRKTNKRAIITDNPFIVEKIKFLL